MKINREGSNSIKRKILSVVLLPIGVLGILISIFGVALLYRSYAESVQEELESATDLMIDCMDFSIEGDFKYEESSLYKGDINITGSSLLHRLKERSGIDTTIFWQDTRIVTTVTDNYGKSAMGTKASPEVVEKVINEGQSYYSNHLVINGIKYIGYYTPLTNSDNSIVGMVFAGKRRDIVIKKSIHIMMWFIVFSIISVLIAFVLSGLYSNKMVTDIDMINDFLKSISEGNLGVVLDEQVTKRKDELGSIGVYASKMRSEIQSMIETDPLTLLFNRRSCNNKLKMLEKDQVKFSIVMCDIDFFKRINDNYGHDAGDYILVTISDMLRENVKDYGFAGRWGGEEFLLVYRLDLDETIKKIEELKKQITEYDFLYRDEHIKMTMTFGVEGQIKEESYEKRIKKADDRLYIGKNIGRNKIIYKDEE